MNEYEKVYMSMESGFSREYMFNRLFKINNYFEYLELLKQNYTEYIPKEVISSALCSEEDFGCYALNRFYGKIQLKIDTDLFEQLKMTDTTGTTIDDFAHLPFDCFTLMFEKNYEVKSVLILKWENELYFHFQEVGKEKVSIQLVLNDKGIIPQYSYSSLYYHREIKPISERTQQIAEKTFHHLISVLHYLTNYSQDEDKVVKDMQYSELASKITPKKLKIKKVQKILDKKNNMVYLKFGGNNVKYVNSNKRDQSQSIETKFIVSGHWRRQRIGKRTNNLTKKIWIQPFSKCINKRDYKTKIYQVS